MQNMNDLSNERKELLEKFTQAKRDLERVHNENKALKAENQKLQKELHEQGDAVQNLVTYINENHG